MRLLYTLVLYLLIPFVFLRLWIKGKTLAQYRQRWRERVGHIPKLNTEQRVIWFHTVSVGEFIAAIPLIQRYIDNEQYQVLVTSMTPTGSDRINASFGEQVVHYYLPFDLPVFISRFLNAMRPTIFICLETELWPNLIHACDQRNIPIIMANMRMSEKSAAGYARFAKTTRAMLQKITVAAIQAQQDAKRLIDLGLPAEKSKVCGNIKFDICIDKDIVERAKATKDRLKQNEPKLKILIAASTHQGEDDIILRAFSQLKRKHDQLRLIIVPRHPQRFDEVFSLCSQSDLMVARKTEGIPENFDILLGDTMGEMHFYFGVADIAFVGGSLIDNGGHNYIEPAAWQLPILSGPSYYNFAEIAQALLDEGALTIAKDATELADQIDALISDTELASQRGDSAMRVVLANRGALEKLVDIIDQNIDISH